MTYYMLILQCRFRIILKMNVEKLLFLVYIIVVHLISHVGRYSVAFV